LQHHDGIVIVIVRARRICNCRQQQQRCWVARNAARIDARCVARAHGRDEAQQAAVRRLQRRQLPSIAALPADGAQQENSAGAARTARRDGARRKVGGRELAERNTLCSVQHARQRRG
jgi:hypothetical protein